MVRNQNVHIDMFKDGLYFINSTVNIKSIVNITDVRLNS